jgi:hypothetical protein
MAWRLHLTNQAIRRLDIIEGEPDLLAAWSRRDRVLYYEVETGTPRGERLLEIPDTDERDSEAWRNFVAELKAPNSGHLPLVQTPRLTVHTTDDGRMRLYTLGENELYLENDGKEIKLESGEADAFPALALDRFLGLSAALDTGGKLHVYQQHITVGAFDLGLNMSDELRPEVAISRGGGSIFVTDGQTIVLTDSGGQVRKQLKAHYFIRRMSCSPDGRYLVTADMDPGVIRVYEGAELALTHQRFAIDLVAEATQVQLLADLPPATVALSALTIDSEGRIALSLSGVICMTDLTFMDELPRPQPLL